MGSCRRPGVVQIGNQKSFDSFTQAENRIRIAVSVLDCGVEVFDHQRVQELVTELYLTEGKKRERHWKSLRTHLAKLEVPEATIDHLVDSDNPELVANLVEKLQNK